MSSDRRRDCGSLSRAESKRAILPDALLPVKPRAFQELLNFDSCYVWDLHESTYRIVITRLQSGCGRPPFDRGRLVAVLRNPGGTTLALGCRCALHNCVLPLLVSCLARS